jgi:hypothetical protein
MSYLNWVFRVLLGVLLGSLLLWSPIGRLLERGVDAHLARMHQRQLANQTTNWDYLQCRLLYGSIVTFGRLAYPEGSAILAHYLQGNGRPLTLPAGYLRNSPVVRRQLATLPVGQTQVVTLTQREDWRLSYALNPFRLRREAHRVLLYQWIVFESPPAARTVLNLGLVRFTVPDGLVHVLHPRPFLAHCEWAE